MFIETLKKMFPGGADLHTPVLGAAEKTKLAECVDSTFVSSVGPMTTEVEKRLSEFTGARYAAAVANGTSALHLCLHALGITRGDLVIVPAMTFVATANAVLYTGARCLFTDIEEERLGIDPKKLDKFLIEKCPGGVLKATGEKVRALVLVHLFGIPSQIHEVAEICARHKIELVEDAAESLGSYYKGKHTGNTGRLAALSFNGNKIVTAGGGGAVLTNDHELFSRIKHVSTTAKKSKDVTFFHDEMGFNYRMPNLNAALLLAQLDQLDVFLEKKRRVHERYADMLSTVDEGILQTCPRDSNSNYWLNNFILGPKFAARHREYLELLNQAGIRARPAWDLMHTLPFLKDMPRMEDLSIAEEYARRLISLPSSAHLAA